MTSGDLTFDLTLKMTRSTFLMIFDELSDAASRMPLRSSGAELDGGGGVKPLSPPSTPWKIQTTSMARVRYTPFILSIAFVP